MSCEEWKLKSVLTIALLCLLLGAACGDDNGSAENNANGDPACDDGDEYVVDGNSYCVFSQPITEEGFSCPPDFAVGSSYGDLIICAEDGDVPDELLDTVVEEYDEGLPTGPCVALTCPQSDVCQSGDCVERQCWNDSDCDEGYSCATGECVSTDDSGEDRILLVASSRSSWQCTDSSANRFDAFDDAISTLVDDQQIPTAVIRYSSWVQESPFTTESDDFQWFLDRSQGLGPASDLQGAIATAMNVIESDANSDDSEHNYHIVFVETAAPNPICTDDCQNDDLSGFEEDASFEFGVCEAEPEDIPEGEYVDFDAPCTDYNVFDSLSQRLQDLEAAAPNTVIHFALATDDAEMVESTCGTDIDFAEQTADAQELFSDLLIEIEDGGEFVDTTPGELDLLDILQL